MSEDQASDADGIDRGGFVAATIGADASLAVEITGLDKHFGGTKALSNASLRVRRGTVHALLGGNGSGKSTTIKILAAVHQADAGQLRVFGNEYPLSNYTSAIAQQAGFRFVHQDLGLFEDLSIQENFALDAGYPRNSAGGVDWRQLRKRVAGLLTEYELDIDPRRPIRDLRPADRTIVAIARALQDQEGDELILVLDEPTASLAAHESGRLLDLVRRRSDQGQTVVMVSHRMQEVLSVAHDFTVFRDGKVAGVLTDASPTEDQLIELMAGAAVQSLRPSGSVSHRTGKLVLEMSEVHSGPLEGVDLQIHRGEIVGVAGLVGSGRSSLLQTVFGAVQPASGTMSVAGTPYSPSQIEDAIHSGIGMVPEDRGRDAAFPEHSVSENLALAMLKEYSHGGWMSRSRERRAAADLIKGFKVKVAGPRALFTSMSGGNQQKVILARWLQRKPLLLLLDEPTQGVDVMSRADIYSVIREAAASGCAALVASSDMSELHALCDRIVFLAGGKITGEVAAESIDVDSLTSLVLRERNPTGASAVTHPDSSASVQREGGTT